MITDSATPPPASPEPSADAGNNLIRYTANSRIQGKSPVGATSIFAAVHNLLLIEERHEVWSYFRMLSTLCDTLGLDSVILAAQWDLETDTGKSKWWRERRNPAGIGVTGDPAQNEASQTWPDGEAAAYGHVAHMVAYVWGPEWETAWLADWPSPLEADQRFNAPIAAGYRAERLADLNGTWAVDPQDNYDGKLASRANRMVARAREAMTSRLAKP